MAAIARRAARRSSVTTALLTLVAALALAAATPVAAATLLVASYGVDGPDCGTKTAPCRSVSRAIALATDGATVEVGPGRYGDVDGDGSFTDAGDEAAEIGTGCNCVVHVTKRLTIVSRDGAGVTVIDGGGAGADVIGIDVAGTVLGKAGKGFTVTNGRDGIVSNADTIAIAGNVAVRNANHGMNVTTSHSTITDNRAVANGNDGFQCSGTDDSLFARNVATENADEGFNADNRNVLVDNLAARNGDLGFNAQQGNLLRGDVAVGNAGEGFRLNDENTFVGCIADGNVQGMRLSQGNTVTKCAVVGNTDVGIAVSSGGNVITKTSIFGNATNASLPASRDNCGTLVASGVVLQATTNFWGAPTGPGVDPADRFCNDPGAATSVAPVATKEMKVRAVAAR